MNYSKLVELRKLFIHSDFDNCDYRKYYKFTNHEKAYSFISQLNKLFEVLGKENNNYFRPKPLNPNSLPLNTIYLTLFFIRSFETTPTSPANELKANYYITPQFIRGFKKDSMYRISLREFLYTTSIVIQRVTNKYYYLEWVNNKLIVMEETII